MRLSFARVVQRDELEEHRARDHGVLRPGAVACGLRIQAEAEEPLRGSVNRREDRDPCRVSLGEGCGVGGEGACGAGQDDAEPGPKPQHEPLRPCLALAADLVGSLGARRHSGFERAPRLLAQGWGGAPADGPSLDVVSQKTPVALEPRSREEGKRGEVSLDGAELAVPEGEEEVEVQAFSLREDLERLPGRGVKREGLAERRVRGIARRRP